MSKYRRLGRIAIVTVVAAACAVGGSAVGYAASRSKPLSSVCVAKKGSHALSAPGKHGCRKGTVKRTLPAGARGPRGAKGAPGAPGATTILRPRTYRDLPANSSSSNLSICPAGSTAIGGGYDLSTPSADVHVSRSTFETNGAGQAIGWDVALTTTVAVTVYVTAVCAQS